MRIELDIHGDVQVRRELLRFGERATDARPAFRSIATLLRRSEQRQFATSGGYASGGWAPLAMSTVLEKQRLRARGESRYTRAILRETGALMESLTRKVDPGHIEHVEPHQLVFGTQVSYAKYHQLGTRSMPRRRPVEVRAQDRVEMVKRLQRFLVTGHVR